MSTGDWALAITGVVLIALAGIGSAVYFIRSDFRMTLSATIQKRNPPQPRPKPDGQQNVTDINSKGSAA